MLLLSAFLRGKRHITHKNKMAANGPTSGIRDSLTSFSVSDDPGRKRRGHHRPSEPNTPLRRVSSLNFVGSRQLHRGHVDGTRPALRPPPLTGRQRARDHDVVGEEARTPQLARNVGLFLISTPPPTYILPMKTRRELFAR